VRIGVYPSVKLSALRSFLSAQSGGTAYIVSDLTEIAWLLNLRSSDIPYVPVFTAYLVVRLDSATLFVNRDRLPLRVVRGLQDFLKVELAPYEDIWSALRTGNWSGGKVAVRSLRLV
jgi:Xaa-Pro aminopeptidase